MRRDNLVQSLSALTGGLTPAGVATPDDLRLIRRLLARTVLAGHDILAGSAAVPPEADPADLDATVREELTAAAQAAAAPSDPMLDSVELPANLRVFRRSTPVGLVGTGGRVPARAVGQRGHRTFGP